MTIIEKELFPDYEWEVDVRCARCGSTRYLIFDEESEEIYCGPCLDFLRRHSAPPPAALEIDDDDDYVW